MGNYAMKQYYIHLVAGLYLRVPRKAYNFLTDKTSVGGLVVMEKTNEA
jgi:hypothetical protein